MASEQLLQRADLLGTQVITRDTGKRLGVVSQLWVDVDRREVVALGLRATILSGVVSGIQQTMYLESISQIGDVVLVDDDTVVDEEIDVEPYTTLIGSEVITETGEFLGRVRGYKFSVENGQVISLVIASVGFPQIPDQVVSTYELSMDEVVSSGPDRLIVFEGSESKLRQLSVGLLERIGLGKPPWERDEDEYYVAPVSTANQLPSGVKVAVPETNTTAAPAARESVWEADNWEATEVPPLQQPLRQPEPISYNEESNWGDDDDDEYEKVYVEDRPLQQPQYMRQYDDVTNDAWADDDNPQPYAPPQVNLPERKKVVEYEEETDY